MRIILLLKHFTMKYEGKIYGKVAGKYIEIHTTKDLDESISNKEKLIAAKKAFSEYVKSEGCSCCRDTEAHEKAAEKIAAALGFEKYKDGSGFDFYSA